VIGSDDGGKVPCVEGCAYTKQGHCAGARDLSKCQGHPARTGTIQGKSVACVARSNEDVCSAAGWVLSIWLVLCN